MWAIGLSNNVIAASENLASGDFVNRWDDGGTTKVRKADATTEGKRAHGFVLAAVTAGNNATVYRPSQENTQLSGLTPGAMYYLSTTAGGYTATAPAATGNVYQVLGEAISSTSLGFHPSEPITRA